MKSEFTSLKEFGPGWHIKSHFCGAPAEEKYFF
jgi:hypothetical protein